MTRAHEVRSHCNNLRMLYVQLERAFQRVLSPAELSEVRVAFDHLERFHDEGLHRLQEIMSWLAATASNVLQAVDLGDLNTADELIKRARIDVLPQRQAMSSAVNALLSLESSYLEVTRKAQKT
jgi:hypothetical protein